MIKIAEKGYGVDFNQLVHARNASFTIVGITETPNEDGSISYKGTSTELFLREISYFSITYELNHKYLFLVKGLENASTTTYELRRSNYGFRQNTSGIIRYNGSGETLTNGYPRMVIYAGVTVDINVTVNIIDLTQMFGEGNEPDTVEEFKSMYPNDYYPFTLGTLQHSKNGYVTSYYPTPIREKVELPIDDIQGRFYSFSFPSSTYLKFPIGKTIHFHIDEYHSAIEDARKEFAYRAFNSQELITLYKFPSYSGTNLEGTFVIPSDMLYMFLYLGTAPTTDEPEQYCRGLKFWWGRELPIESKKVGTLVQKDNTPFIQYNYAQRELPVGFVQLDYIESTGTQRIDTGVSGDVRIVATFQFTSTNATAYWKVVGALGVPSGRAYTIEVNYPANTLVNSLVASSTISSQTFDTEIHTYDNIFSAYTVYDSSIGEWGIFKSSTKGRLYSMQMYQSNTLVRNFIPCYQFSTQIEGLYDTVGKQFYTNQGTGKFRRGREINSGNLLDLSKFVEGVKDNFVDNTYIIGLASNNSYSYGSIKKFEVDNQNFTLLNNNAGFGVAYVVDLERNHKYRLDTQANTTDGVNFISIMYYSATGQFLKFTKLGANDVFGTNGVGYKEFTTDDIDFKFTLINFNTASGKEVTFSNIALHEIK